MTIFIDYFIVKNQKGRILEKMPRYCRLRVFIWFEILLGRFYTIKNVCTMALANIKYTGEARVTAWDGGGNAARLEDFGPALRHRHTLSFFENQPFQNQKVEESFQQ